MIESKTALQRLVESEIPRTIEISKDQNSLEIEDGLYSQRINFIL